MGFKLQVVMQLSMSLIDTLGCESPPMCLETFIERNDRNYCNTPNIQTQSYLSFLLSLPLYHPLLTSGSHHSAFCYFFRFYFSNIKKNFAATHRNVHARAFPFTLTPKSYSSISAPPIHCPHIAYREYKEALRQQRNQDTTAIYRPKEQQTPTDSTPSSTDSPTSFKSQTSTPSPTIFSSNQSSPTSPHPTQKSSLLDQKNRNGQSNGKLTKSSVTFANPENDNSANKAANKANKNDESAADGSVQTGLKKPVQKVTPSRNTNATYQSPTNWATNGNHKTVEITTTVTKEYNVYVKPSSPTKSVQASMGYNNVPSPTLVSSNGKGNGTTKVGPKQNR